MMSTNKKNRPPNRKQRNILRAHTCRVVCTFYIKKMHAHVRGKRKNHPHNRFDDFILLHFISRSSMAYMRYALCRRRVQNLNESKFDPSVYL